MTMYKLDFNQIKQDANGRWLQILEQCGLSVTPRQGGTHTTCPICSAENSFRVDDKSINRTWICKCGSGDGINLLQKALNLNPYESFKMVHEAMGGEVFKTTERTAPNRTAPSAQDKARRQQTVNNALKYSSRTPTPEALDYYDGRGIYCSRVKHDFVRYGMQRHKDIKGFIHPVIMPVISFYRSAPIGLVRIYIDEGKIMSYGVDIQRKPFLKGGVDNLSGAGTWFTKGNIRVLHAVEGFENALSIASALKTTRIVCGHTASLLGSLIIPDTVQILHIWGDWGKAGEKAVNRLSERYASTVQIIKHYPNNRVQDWNDTIIKDGGREIKEHMQEKKE